MNEDLVREIGKVVFTPVRIREGYDMAEVDHFLDELEREVAAGRSVRDRIDGKGFTPVRLREGYTMAEVDHFLEWLAAAMDARVGATGSTQSRQEDPTADDAAVQGSPSTRPLLPEEIFEVPSVITEHPGLWERMFRRNR